MPTYGYVRDTANAHDYAKYRAAGIDTILLNPNDPNFAQTWANAQRAGGNFGIWMPSDPNLSPEAWAKRAGYLANTYHPSVLVPDVEFEGKGYQGSRGWQWNDRAAQLLRQVAPSQNVAINMLPNQEDFNYEAWTRAGVSGYLPATFGEKLTDTFDPNQIVQTLLKRGVPLDKISTILAPGQRPVAGVGYGVYALDDFNDRTLAMLRQAGVPSFAVPGGTSAGVGRTPFAPSGPVQIGGRTFMRIAPVTTPADIQRALGG